MERERVWPSAGSPSDSLHLSPPECQLILPSSPDSQLDTPAPSEWQAALTARNFPPLSVSQSWLEITGPRRKHSPPAHLKITFHPFLSFISPSSLHFFIFLIPTPLLFNVINFRLPLHFFAPIQSVLLFWQLNDKKDEEEEEGESEREKKASPPEWSQNDVMGAFVLLVWRLPFPC